MARSSAALVGAAIGFACLSAVAQTASGLSGAPALGNAPISGATTAPAAPTAEGATGQKPPPKNTYRELPSNARLDASSKRIDRQIKRGICVGC